MISLCHSRGPPPSRLACLLIGLRMRCPVAFPKALMRQLAFVLYPTRSMIYPTSEFLFGWQMIPLFATLITAVIPDPG